MFISKTDNGYDLLNLTLNKQISTLNKIGSDDLVRGDLIYIYEKTFMKWLELAPDYETPGHIQGMADAYKAITGRKIDIDFSDEQVTVI